MRREIVTADTLAQNKIKRRQTLRYGLLIMIGFVLIILCKIKLSDIIETQKNELATVERLHEEKLKAAANANRKILPGNYFLFEQIKKFDLLYEFSQQDICFTNLSGSAGDWLLEGETESEKWLLQNVVNKKHELFSVDHVEINPLGGVTFAAQLKLPARHYFNEAQLNHESLKKVIAYQILYDAANFSQFEIESLQWMNDEVNANEQYAHFVLRAKGHYAIFINFLTILAQSQHHILLTKWSIKPLNTDQQMYYLDISLKPAKKNLINISHQKLIPISHKKIFCNERHVLFSAQSFNHNREKFSVREMKMLGYVKRDNDDYAILRLPNSQIIHARAHDVIGIEKSQVIAVLNNEITFMEKNALWKLYK